MAMRLWILGPVQGLAPEDDPWYGYNNTHGFVIRAESEQAARAIADANGGGENKAYLPGSFGHPGHGRPHPWLDPGLSTCEELTIDGEPGVILEAYTDG